jgi:hypothetical protein
MAYDLNPDEVQAFGARRRAAYQNYGTQQASLGLYQQKADTDYGSNFGDLTRQWDRMRTRMPGTYMNRGLSRSGIYGQGLNDYHQGRTSSFGRLANDYYHQKAQYGMQSMSQGQQLYNTMADIDEQERLRRAQIAAQLTGAY